LADSLRVISACSRQATGFGASGTPCSRCLLFAPLAASRTAIRITFLARLHPPGLVDPATPGCFLLSALSTPPSEVETTFNLRLTPGKYILNEAAPRPDAPSRRRGNPPSNFARHPWSSRKLLFISHYTLDAVFGQPLSRFLGNRRIKLRQGGKLKVLPRKGRGDRAPNEPIVRVGAPRVAARLKKILSSSIFENCQDALSTEFFVLE
jgi:hypothetical protein